MIKKHNMKLTAISILVGASLLTGCGASTNVAGESNEVTNNITAASNHVLNVTYDEDDYYTDWKSGEATEIDLSNLSNSTVNGVSVNDSVLTISSAGTYVLSGELTEGQVIVDVAKTDTVRLVLNGASIHSSTTSPIYVKTANKVVVSLEAGTENTISDGTDYVFEEGATEPDAAIYSKDDLTINGTGTLNINANYKDGLVSKDDLKIVEGNFVIKSADDGIKGKDMVAIKAGEFEITSGGDAIKSSNATDADKGFIYVEDGHFNINAGTDGIQAETILEINGGEFDIVTGGGAANAEPHVESNGKGGMGGGKGQFAVDPNMTEEEKAALKEQMKQNRPQMENGQMPQGEPVIDAEGTPVVNAEGVPPSDKPDAAPTTDTSASATTKDQSTANSTTDSVTDTSSTSTTTEETSDSMKALKATNSVIINGGTFDIDACDDAVHTNDHVEINGGTLNIATGDDGVHGDKTLVINGGAINISNSYEGLEAEDVTINNGDIRIVATDDAINAASSTETSNAPGQAASGVQLTINGGYVHISAGADGLDANGNLYVKGGKVVIAESANRGGDLPIDSDGVSDLTGGTIVVMSGATTNSSEGTTLRSVSMSFSSSQEANTTVAILDQSGNLVVAVEPSKAYQGISVFSEKFQEGSTYSVVYGGTLSGEGKDGVYESGSYSGGKKVTDFTISGMSTYLNESGVTEAPANEMGGRGNGMKNINAAAPSQTTNAQTTNQ